MARYWYMECPICNQGRLFVKVRNETERLFLECEECSNAWNAPEQVLARDSAFLAIAIDSDFATVEDIENGGWFGYRFKRVD